MIIFAIGAENLKGIRAVAIHTDISIGVDFGDDFFYFFMFVTDEKFH